MTTPSLGTLSGTPPPNVVYAAEYPLTLEVWDVDGAMLLSCLLR